ncbi:hypothetical protein GCM10027515_07800 [Schumannella luteola]|uniref:Surface-anchored protein n=1 Tax=Schumannella luteola TaxID=472059 RepID=A0A852Y9P2_9MICO|nr:choice-of-anchor M domain-containing protein [Schumannella luteola]NYG98090.1 surface-anchored protein [Schumannella luteola]TPX01814.1 hypothetical protein FJ656_25845 [Schumannella luteola]
MLRRLSPAPAGRRGQRARALRPTTSSRRPLALLGAVALALATIALPSAALADDLDQNLSSDEPIADDTRAIESGHVDIGPRYVDGEWTVMIHDDTARTDPSTPSVWRHAEKTVLRVVDAAEQRVPDDPAYEFLGAKAGSEVLIVPQTQNPQVVWVGWNTQDPEAMQRMDRGATFTLLGLDGPGTLVTYLQSGNFTEPTVLWDSRSTKKQQPVWVDVNTHTHANWVFSEPGVYLATFRVSADLIDGSTVDDVRTLRFAVGSATSVDAALAATPTITAANAPAVDDDATGDDASAAAETDGAARVAADTSSVLTVVGVIVGGGLLLIAVVVIVVARSSRAKRRAEQP